MAEDPDPCETCRWWKSDDNTKGECHLQPPQVVRTEPYGVAARYPVLRAADWCGQWEKKK